MSPPSMAISNFLPERLVAMCCGPNPVAFSMMSSVAGPCSVMIVAEPLTPDPPMTACCETIVLALLTLMMYSEKFISFVRWMVG